MKPRAGKILVRHPDVRSVDDALYLRLSRLQPIAKIVKVCAGFAFSSEFPDRGNQLFRFDFVQPHSFQVERLLLLAIITIIIIIIIVIIITATTNNSVFGGDFKPSGATLHVFHRLAPPRVRLGFEKSLHAFNQLLPARSYFRLHFPQHPKPILLARLLLSPVHAHHRRKFHLRALQTFLLDRLEHVFGSLPVPALAEPAQGRRVRPQLWRQLLLRLLPSSIFFFS
mmetsp:Transcript_3931/g.12992  ORF Transcript_3931/g.12992 Transcript_3931/m.12992 type:complete len:226 (+) Transcript_3931:2018-2695(+)